LALAFLLNNSKRKLDNNERLFTALFSTKQTPLGSSPILSRESKVPVKERNIPANDSDSFVANAANLMQLNNLNVKWKIEAAIGNGKSPPPFKGVQRGEIFYAAYEDGLLKRSKIDEMTGKMFYDEILKGELLGPTHVLLDRSQGKVFVSETNAGVIRYVDIVTGRSQFIVKGELKPTYMAADFEQRHLYYICVLSPGIDPTVVDQMEIELVPKKRTSKKSSLEKSDSEFSSAIYGIMRVPMDPQDARVGSISEIAVVLDGESRGIAIDSGFLYWTDYHSGVLSRVPIQQQIPLRLGAVEVLTASLKFPVALDVKNQRLAIANQAGRSFIVADLGNVSSHSDFPIPKLVNLPAIVVGMRLDDEQGMIWSDERGMVLRVDLQRLFFDSGPISYEPTNRFLFNTLASDLGRITGFDLYLFPKSKGLRITVENKYTRLNSFPYVPVFEEMPWVLGRIVEPGRDTVYSVVSPKPSCRYEWVIEGDAGEKLSFEGAVIHGLKFYRTGNHKVLLSEIQERSEVILRRLHNYVVVKYVRREIRSLFEEDRGRFLDAMRAMQITPTRQGKMIYGPRYLDMNYMTEAHNKYAGDRVCDHLHNGLGFFPLHMALTLLFEQSMQVIDPELCTPYWDFTIEAHEVFSTHDGNFDAVWGMQIFDSEWFGDGGSTQYHTIADGRFAWTKVEDNCWTCNHNSYGFLRAPWNVNNSPYIQRWRTLGGGSIWNVHSGWPTCECHLNAIRSYDTWEKFGLKIASEPHGTVHGILGGTFNSEKAYDALEQIVDFEDAMVFRSHSYNTPKNMWRTGVMHCPDFCSSDTAMDDCKCTCGTDAELTTKLEDPSTLTFFFHQVTAGGKGKGVYNNEQKRAIIQIMCSAGTAIGDQLESASPADVIFWVMHPTMERLYFWHQLKKPFSDMSWPEEGSKSYHGTFYHNISDTCYGHRPFDIMPYKMYLDDENQRIGAYYTGHHFLRALDVTSPSYAAPYVYDNYKWPHCAEEGFDFDGL